MGAPASIDVCMCVNRAHFMGLLAAVNSITANAARPQAFSFRFVVGAGESGELRAALANCFPDPVFRYVVAEFRAAPRLETFLRAGRDFTYADHGSQVMNFSRFYLRQIYPDLGRIVYLDADLIVRGDLAELDRLATLESRALAAVPIGTFATWKGGIRRESRHVRHLDFGEPVFNNGIYVTDLAAWEEKGILEKLEGWIEVHRRSLADFVFGTQSIMNLAFYRDFQPLPPEWNVRPLGNDAAIPERTLRTAKILHWAGRRKPWRADGLYRDYWLPYALDPGPSGPAGGGPP